MTDDDKKHLVEAAAFALLFTQLDPTGCEASHEQAMRTEERARRIAGRYAEAKEAREYQSNRAAQQAKAQRT